MWNFTHNSLERESCISLISFFFTLFKQKSPRGEKNWACLSHFFSTLRQTILFYCYIWHHNIHHNTIQHNDIQHKVFICNTEHKRPSTEMTFSITTLSIMCNMQTVVMLSVNIDFFLCWVSLCWMSLCWVSWGVIFSPQVQLLKIVPSYLHDWILS